ncbi:hypothetical protein ACOMHN_000358 [Nucella lapillus]
MLKRVFFIPSAEEEEVEAALPSEDSIHLCCCCSVQCQLLWEGCCCWGSSAGGCPSLGRCQSLWFSPSTSSPQSFIMEVIVAESRRRSSEGRRKSSEGRRRSSEGRRMSPEGSRRSSALKCSASNCPSNRKQPTKKFGVFVAIFLIL